MGDYQRSSQRERKPARRFGGGFETGRPKGRFSRNSSESSGRFGSRPFRRDGDRSNRQPLEMHTTVCDKCGKECTVPFKPTQNKPVYCSDCFRKNDHSFVKSDSAQSGRSDHSTEDLAKIHQKLDKIMQALGIE
ncbi:TPA: hypothetical protein HA249_06110 [Candidatus Woesearchaeota archaeon]|nr:hypothetical protein [Candidatus Woesearchaeota archaeon]